MKNLPNNPRRNFWAPISRKVARQPYFWSADKMCNFLRGTNWCPRIFHGVSSFWDNHEKPKNFDPEKDPLKLRFRNFWPRQSILRQKLSLEIYLAKYENLNPRVNEKKPPPGPEEEKNSGRAYSLLYRRDISLSSLLYIYCIVPE